MRAIKRMILGLAIILLGIFFIGFGFLGWIIPIAGFLMVLYGFVDPRKE